MLEDMAEYYLSAATATTNQAFFALLDRAATRDRVAKFRERMKARGLRFPSDPVPDRIALEPGWDVA